VEQLYSAGAAAVTVAAISAGQRKKLFADWLLIQLPQRKSKRNSLRKICQAFCRKRGRGSSAEFDLGETTCG